MRTLFPLVLLVLVAASYSLQAQQHSQPFTVHGQLYLCNGRWGAKIWIVGTKRILLIHWAGVEVLDMPKPLINLLATFKEEREIYADFVVEPLTPYKRGEAQEVRVVSASNIVVVERGKVILKKKSLTPN